MEKGSTIATLREEMVGDLQLAGLGERTQEAYVRAVRKLAEYYRTAPDELNERQVRKYFLYLKNERGAALRRVPVAADRFPNAEPLRAP